MISNEQLATGVQAIAPVQANAQKQISTEASKMNAIGARLLDRARRIARRRPRAQRPEHAGRGRNARRRIRLPGGATGGGAAADDAFGGPWGGFVNVAYSWGNVDQTTLQDAYKYGSFNILAGADYRVSDSVVLGGAISYSDTHSDFDQSLGDVKAATTGVVGYGTWYRDDWYVDGFLAYGYVDYDSTRNINIPSNNPAAAPIITSATSNPKGDQWSAAIGVGRDFKSGDITITPTARLGYIWVRNKAFSENEPIDGLALAVNERTIRSLQSALGVKFGTTVNTTMGVFGPYFNAQWLHEFENDNPSIISKYVADPTNQFFAIPTAGPTRDYAHSCVGTSATFPDNLSAFLQFSAAVGLRERDQLRPRAGPAQAVLMLRTAEASRGAADPMDAARGAAARQRAAGRCAALLLTAALAACATPAERFDRRAIALGMQATDLPGEGFNHRAYVAGCRAGFRHAARLHRARRHAVDRAVNRVSDDPTPRTPFALELMAQGFRTASLPRPAVSTSSSHGIRDAIRCYGRTSGIPVRWSRAWSPLSAAFCPCIPTATSSSSVTAAAARSRG